MREKGFNEQDSCVFTFVQVVMENIRDFNTRFIFEKNDWIQEKEVVRKTNNFLLQLLLL